MKIRARFAVLAVATLVAALPPVVLSVDPIPTLTTISLTPDAVGPREVITVDVSVSPAPTEADLFVGVTFTWDPQNNAFFPVPLDVSGTGSIEVDTTNWKLGVWSATAHFNGSASSAASTSVPDLLTVTAPMDPPPAVADPSMISAGYSWTCALDEAGELSCWGGMPSGLDVIPEGEFIDVDSSGCAVAASGELVCWGEGRPWVYWHPPGGTFLEVSGSCAIRVDHTLACWAEPFYTDLLNPPFGAFHGLSVYSIACALDTDDEIVCWGGFLPNGPPAGAFEQVTVGAGRACARRADGSIACWGWEDSKPVGTFTDVASGGKHNCGIRVDGDIACAGWDGGPPAEVEGPFDRLSVGGWHMCGRHAGDEIECWGATSYPYWQIQPSIVSDPPPGGLVGWPYQHQFQSSSVVPAPTFSVVSGTLPAGLGLSTGGALTGTPTTAGSSGAIIVQASNGIAPASQESFELVIEPAPPVQNAGPVVIGGGVLASSSATQSVATPAQNALTMRLSNDGESWEVRPYSATTGWNLADPATGGSPTDGLKTVFVAWQGGTGTWTSAQSDTVILDTAAPVGESVAIAGGAQYVNSPTVSITAHAADATSGLSSVAISNDGFAWTTRVYGPTQSWTLPGGDGVKTVYVKWMDLAGNWSSIASDSVILDTLPPTGSVAIEDDHGATPISNVTLHLSASDTVSAVTDVALSNDGVTWTTRPYSTLQSWPLASGEGTRTVWAKFRDEAGQWSAPVSDSTVVDLYVIVSRQSGPNRYATAAAVSAGTFGAHVPVAFIANGSSFPDALSAAAAAGHLGGPLLLVTATSIPPETATELARLQPARIVIAGGTGVVSSAVASALHAYTAGSVTRLAGANRYATSAAVSAGSFSAGVPVAYVATGSNFPDALAAAAAAGHLGGPLLLVTSSSIPPQVAAELSRLKPARIVIAGGTSVVGDAVMAALDAYTSGPVTRQSGANRYATAAAISAATFGPPAPVVYIATGLTFPDALAAAAAAGHLGGPLLLVTVDSLPGETFTELERLNPVRIIIAGGVSVVGSHVQADLGAF